MMKSTPAMKATISISSMMMVKIICVAILDEELPSCCRVIHHCSWNFLVQKEGGGGEQSRLNGVEGEWWWEERRWVAGTFW